MCAWIIVLSGAAYSLRVLDFDDTDLSCTKDGKAKFDFFYASGDGLIDLNEVMVTAEGNEVKGSWYDRNGNDLTHLEKGKRANFVSEIAEFLEDKIYYMKLEYPEHDESMSSVDFEISCPGFEFACEIFSMKIEECYNKEGFVFLEVSGSGFGQYGNTDLIKDFTYVLKGGSKRHEGSLEDMDAEISKKDSIYLLKIPLGYSVSTAYIRGKPYGCDITIDDYDTITYKKCESIQPEELQTTGSAAAGITGSAAAGITGSTAAKTSDEEEPDAEPSQEKQAEPVITSSSPVDSVQQAGKSASPKSGAALALIAVLAVLAYALFRYTKKEK